MEMDVVYDAQPWCRWRTSADGSTNDTQEKPVQTPSAVAVVMLAWLLAGCESPPRLGGTPEETAWTGDASDTANQDNPPGHWGRYPKGGEVARYLMNYAQTFEGDCGPHACTLAGIARWRTPPVVRVHASATNMEIAQTKYAAALINRALPYEAHLKVEYGERRDVAELDETRSGEIFVKFVERLPEHFCGPSAAGCAAASHDFFKYDVPGRRREADWYAGDLDRGLVMVARSWLNEDGTQETNTKSHQKVATIVHELLHAAGLTGGHVPPGAAEPGHPPDGTSGTVMAYETDPDILGEHGYLPSLDEAALIALYGPKAIADTAPEGLYEALVGWSETPETKTGGKTTTVKKIAYYAWDGQDPGYTWTGTWGDETRKTKFTYLGKGIVRGCYVSARQDCRDWTVTADAGEPVYDRETVNYGVREHNGVLVPWTKGPSSSGGVSGRASWTGQLVGLSAEQRPVEGKADLEFDFRHSAPIDGKAAFTEVHYQRGGGPWTANNADYDDKELVYALHSAGNTFHTTHNAGGDAGDVNGRFYGHEHEGAAGALEREDLTAAFGATKDDSYTKTRANESTVHEGALQFEHNWQAFDPQTDLPDNGAGERVVTRPEGARVEIDIRDGARYMFSELVYVATHDAAHHFGDSNPRGDSAGCGGKPGCHAPIGSASVVSYDVQKGEQARYAVTRDDVNHVNDGNWNTEEVDLYEVRKVAGTTSIDSYGYWLAHVFEVEGFTQPEVPAGGTFSFENMIFVQPYVQGTPNTHHGLRGNASWEGDFVGFGLREGEMQNLTADVSLGYSFARNEMDMSVEDFVAWHGNVQNPIGGRYRYTMQCTGAGCGYHQAGQICENGTATCGGVSVETKFYTHEGDPSGCTAGVLNDDMEKYAGAFAAEKN